MVEADSSIQLENLLKLLPQRRLMGTLFGNYKCGPVSNLVGCVLTS